MISVRVNGVHRPCAPKIVTARTIREAVRKANGQKPAAKKVPVVVIKRSPG